VELALEVVVGVEVLEALERVEVLGALAENLVVRFEFGQLSSAPACAAATFV